MSKISERHLAVIEEYFRNGFKKVPAMRAAGYAESTCERTETVFGRPDVKAEISRRVAKRDEKFEVYEGDLLEKMYKIASANLGEIYMKLVENDFNLRCLTDDERYSLGKIDVEMAVVGRGEDKQRVLKVKLATRDVKAALDTLFKHKGLMGGKLDSSDADDLYEQVAKARQAMAQRSQGTQH